MKRYFPLLLVLAVLSGISIVAKAGFNSPLFNYPLVFSGGTMQVRTPLSVNGDITTNGNTVATTGMVIALENKMGYHFGGIGRESQILGVATTTLSPVSFLIDGPQNSLILINGIVQDTSVYSVSSTTFTFSSLIPSGSTISFLRLDNEKTVRESVQTFTGTTTVTLVNDFVVADTSFATFTINLFSASGAKGKVLNIKDIGTAAVIIEPFGAETIDGNPNFSIGAQWAAMTIVSDGANWLIK